MAVALPICEKKFEAVESFFQKTSCSTDILDAQVQHSISPFCADRDSLNALQIRMRPKIQDILRQTNKIGDLQSIKMLYQLQFIQLPDDLLVRILGQLPIKEIEKMAQCCHQLQQLINTNDELQSYIACEKLKALQTECNIPMGDLRVDYTNKKFSVEVGNNLCLWKLTQKNGALPKLHHTLPWISHLIVKDGEPNELIELFKQLKENKKLTTVFLLNCEMSPEAMKALSDFHAFSSNCQRPPYLYLCNLKTSNCELPQSDLPLCMIDPSKASDYCLEKFVTTESDRIDLNELSNQVENDASPSDLIVEKLGSLNSAIKTLIIMSIWYSSVMPAKEAGLPISKKAVDHRVCSFVFSNPHSPAISAALKSATLALS